MKPGSHLIAAGAVGVPLYLVSGSISVAASFGGAMVGVDIDHLIDHLFFSRRPLKLNTVLIPGHAATYSRIVFALHSYELLLAAGTVALLVDSPVLWGFLAGWSMHVVLDEIFNRRPGKRHRIDPLFYFLTYRLINGFRTNRISRLRTTGKGIETTDDRIIT